MDFLKNLILKNKTKVAVIAAFGAVLFLGWKIWITADLDILNRSRKEISASSEKEALLKEIAGLKQRYAQNASVFSKNKNADWLIEEVSQLAAESGLTLLSAIPQTSQEGADFSKNSLSIEATGNYHQLGLFTAKIENHRPVIKIQNVRASVGSQSLQVFMSLAAYSPGVVA